MPAIRKPAASKAAMSRAVSKRPAMSKALAKRPAAAVPPPDLVAAPAPPLTCKLWQLHAERDECRYHFVSSEGGLVELRAHQPLPAPAPAVLRPRGKHAVYKLWVSHLGWIRRAEFYYFDYEWQQ